MAIKATSEIIGVHEASGPDAQGRVHRLGNKQAPGEFTGIASTTRIFQFSGMSGNTVDLEGSINGGQSWVVWASGITTDTALIIDDGPLLMRSNCTSYSAGTIEIYCQKFLSD